MCDFVSARTTVCHCLMKTGFMSHPNSQRMLPCPQSRPWQHMHRSHRRFHWRLGQRQLEGTRPLPCGLHFRLLFWDLEEIARLIQCTCGGCHAGIQNTPCHRGRRILRRSCNEATSWRYFQGFLARIPCCVSQLIYFDRNQD